MAINQLFKIKPTIEIFQQICLLFNIDIKNLDKKYSFTKKELIEDNFETHFDTIIKLLDCYYLPCKKKIYLDNITIQKSITLLRQLLKLYNYSLKSEEHYNNSKKYIMYSVIYNKKNNNVSTNGIISFD